MKATLLYPEYYKDVFISYVDPDGVIIDDIAWLAVNDKLEPFGHLLQMIQL